MSIDFLKAATTHVGKGFVNTLCNGYASDLSEKDKAKQVGIKLKHFNPATKWAQENYHIVDKGTSDRYLDDSRKTIRLKCAALFAGTLTIQPIGLTLNLLNRIGKVFSFSHLWKSSKEKIKFKARLGEWGMDLVRILAAPFILLGMLFGSLQGATISPYCGRKIYSTMERLAYSGGYQRLRTGDTKFQHHYLLAPCCQPSPKAHLGGNSLDKKNAW